MGSLLIALILVGGGIALYFLPVFVAGRRNHPNFTPILVINLFLGWTLIGWVVALAWASTDIRQR